MRLQLDDIFRFLRANENVIQNRYKARVRGVFGSFGRGDHKKGSDVDVLVHFSEGANLISWVGLTSFLEDEFRTRVDVVSDRAVRPEMRIEIESDLIPL